MRRFHEWIFGRIRPLSVVIGMGAVSGEVADVNARKRIKFTSNSVLSETPTLVDLGLLLAHTTENSSLSSAPPPDL